MYPFSIQGCSEIGVYIPYSILTKSQEILFDFSKKIIILLLLPYYLHLIILNFRLLLFTLLIIFFGTVSTFADDHYCYMPLTAGITSISPQKEPSIDF